VATLLEQLSDDEIDAILARDVPAASAQRFALSSQDIIGDEEVGVFFNVTSDSLATAAVAVLRAYASSDNFPEKRHYVTELKLSGEAHALPGPYRCALTRLSAKGEPGKVVQIWRKGWATSLDELEARLGRIFIDVQNGRYGLTRYWPNIARTSLKTLALARRTTKTASNPKADGETHTGTFAVSGGAAAPMEGDGAGVYSETLRIVDSPTTAATLAALTPIVQIGSQIIDPIAFDASAATVSTAKTATLVFRNLANTAAVRLAMEQTITPAQIETAFVGSGKLLPTASWKYLRRQWSEDAESNTGIFAIYFDRNTNTNTTPLYSSVSKEQVTRTWYRVDKATKDALVQPYAEDPAQALGIARASFTYDISDNASAAVTFSHQQYWVSDNHDRTFNVQQVGARQGTGAGTNIYFSYKQTLYDPAEWRVYNGAVQSKQRTYTWRCKYFTGEEWAAAAIAAEENQVVQGSVSIKTIRPNYVKAEWTVVLSDGTWE